MPAPVPPPYGRGTLPDLLPAVLGSLGVTDGTPAGPTSGPDPLPTVRRSLVMLVDGLGAEQLRSRSGHAPTLRRMAEQGASRRLHSGFPSTTATSLASLGTGLPPGSHGLVGYEVLDPARDVLVNQLSWADGPDPTRWQPHRTRFQQAQSAGVEVTRIGPAFFDGSGLTRAALRGGRFVAATALQDRVDAALLALRASPRALVYLYWGEVDKVGHQHGSASWQWGEEVTAVDQAVARILAELPRDCSLHVTADHGMVDVPQAGRLDLAHEPELTRGVRHVGGEPRALQLYCEPGAAPDVAATWGARLTGRMWVTTRDEAIGAGWFGPVEDTVRPRIGDVLAVATSPSAVVDSRRQRPAYLALVGHHGALTPAETEVPWVVVTGD